MRGTVVAAGLIVALGGAGWVLTTPKPIAAERIAGLTGDPQRGASVFSAAGCASCHVAPDAEETEVPILSGGKAFANGFGTFYAPNISPSPEGIGEWSDAEIIDTVMAGVSPGGMHLYPALPYDAYREADPQDMLDLVAYMRTLPPSDVANRSHDVAFPFSVRRGVGLWKRFFLSEGWVVPGDLGPEQSRGRYLVEALGHCGECHTPRNLFGGLIRSSWLGGAENPSGEGRIPNISPGGLDWTEAEIAYYLETGFTPDFDTVGGEMTAVVKNTAKLAPEDRSAIAAYLKAVPPIK